MSLEEVGRGLVGIALAQGVILGCVIWLVIESFRGEK